MSLLAGYADGSFGGDHIDSNSTTGILVTYHGGSVAWSFRKQKTMAMSTAEVKYVAIAADSQHLHVAKRLSVERGLLSDTHCSLKSENQAVCTMITNPHAAKRRKYIVLQHHLVKHMIHHNKLTVKHIPGTIY